MVAFTIRCLSSNFNVRPDLVILMSNEEAE